MKPIVRITGIMRIVGVVLLCVALVLSIYSMIVSSAAWKQFDGKLGEQGIKTNIIDRISFTNGYFGSLEQAVGNIEAGSSARANAIRANFERFESEADIKLAFKDQSRRTEIYDYFRSEFDYAAFLNEYELREDDAERLALDDIYEYLDSLTVSKAPKGKALPNLSAGQSEAFFPGRYDELLALHGEDVLGEYIDFMQTIKRMLESRPQAQAIASAQSYMDTEFTIEAYSTERAAIEREEASAQNASFIANFAGNAKLFAERTPTQDMIITFFDTEYARVKTQYPEATYQAFIVSVRECIDAGAQFNGSYRTLIEYIRANEGVAAENAFKTYMQAFTRELVAEADKRKGIGLVSALWLFAALRLWFWGAGAAFVILGITLRKLLIAAFMKKQTFNTVQDDPDILLRVSHLKQYFKSGTFVNKAVDDINFYIKKGEVFGLVGESGCGKTTTGRTIINLYDPTEGDVYFQGLRVSSTMNGMAVNNYQTRAELNAKIKALKAEPGDHSEEIARLKRAYSERFDEIQKRAYESEEEKRRSQKLYREKRKAELTSEFEQDIMSLTGEAREARRQRYETELKVAARDNIMTKMQMIFQDPIASINPRMTVREIIAEGLRIRGVKDQAYIDEKVYEMLELVGLVREHADRYPHEFSGGQRQRIGIARAIVLQPDLIIADEPISALDVSIQAQVINLLNELRSKMGLTILFIAHNLSVVKYFSDRIAVMYYGKIVELTTSEELFKHPLHPYTKSLLSAIPYPDPHYEKTRRRIEYNPVKQHDYKQDKPSMHEITPGHYIHCNEAELKEYRKELGL